MVIPFFSLSFLGWTYILKPSFSPFRYPFLWCICAGLCVQQKQNLWAAVYTILAGLCFSSGNVDSSFRVDVCIRMKLFRSVFVHVYKVSQFKLASQRQWIEFVNDSWYNVLPELEIMLPSRKNPVISKFRSEKLDLIILMC